MHLPVGDPLTVFGSYEKVSMNICIKIFLWKYVLFLLDKYFGVKLLSRISVCLPFKVTFQLFSKRL